MNQLDESKGMLEELEITIGHRLLESKDPEYTVYLQRMLERVRQQKHQTDLLKTELDRSYQMYQRRMEVMEASGREVVQPKPVPLEPQWQSNDIQENGIAEEQVQPVRMQPEYIQQATPKKKARNAEFTIGAAVLSIVGGGFILAALVTLGMTFMGGVFKGICLYAVALAFLFVSELFLYRRWPMLGATFSSIGIGGLYLSTAVNYLGLHNFNLLFTLGITVVITILVIWLSRKRDSVLYRIIGMIAGYLCFFTVREGITDIEFIVAAGMILLMNVLCILIPVRRARVAINITHMAVNTFFALCFAIRAAAGCEVSAGPMLLFVISSVIVMLILYVAQFFCYQKENNTSCYEGFMAVYYFGVICHLIMVGVFASELVDAYMNEWYVYGSAIVLGVIGLITMGVLCWKKCAGQGHIYSFLNLTIFCLVGGNGGEWRDVICLFLLFVLAKLLCWRKTDMVYRINDIMLTLCLCTSALLTDAPQEYVPFAGVLLGILLISYWKTFYEIALTLTVVIYTAAHLPDVLQLPAVVGILLVGILLFNNVKRWQGKGILVFNIFALVMQAICFLRLNSEVYRSEYFVYLCMLVFGLATIVLTLQEKYRMDCKGKHLILAVFLTYMAFILRTDIPVVNSVLLMVIALVCVGMGFALGKKSVRIYGLVLSLVVCGKLVLYDFFGAATVQKMILFFAVGAIALVIAAIYIILEKKNNS